MMAAKASFLALLLAGTRTSLLLILLYCRATIELLSRVRVVIVALWTELTQTNRSDFFVVLASVVRQKEAQAAKLAVSISDCLQDSGLERAKFVACGDMGASARRPIL